MTYNATALLAWAADCVMLSLLLLPLWFKNRERKFLLLWTGGLLSQGIGLAGMALMLNGIMGWTALPTFLGLIGCRALAAAGMMMLYGHDRPLQFVGTVITLSLVLMVIGQIPASLPVPNVLAFYISATVLSGYVLLFLLRRDRGSHFSHRIALPAIFVLELVSSVVLFGLFLLFYKHVGFGLRLEAAALIFGFLLFSVKVFMAVWLSIEKLDAELRNMAFNDPLTGIPNRRGFLNGVAQLINTEDNDTVFACFVLDIDHFKKINDLYGHNVGDRALVMFTDVTRKCLRSTDVFARSGGEEFTIFARVKDKDTALMIAERIRSTLENTVFEERDVKLNITVSIGLAIRQRGVGNVETLLSQADKALYRAKESGRNCVVFYNRHSIPNLNTVNEAEQNKTDAVAV